MARWTPGADRAGVSEEAMATKTVVCPDCGAPAAPGRYACADCGALIAAVAAPARAWGSDTAAAAMESADPPAPLEAADR